VCSANRPPEIRNRSEISTLRSCSYQIQCYRGHPYSLISHIYIASLLHSYPINSVLHILSPTTRDIQPHGPEFTSVSGLIIRLISSLWLDRCVYQWIYSMCQLLISISMIIFTILQRCPCHHIQGGITNAWAELLLEASSPPKLPHYWICMLLPWVVKCDASSKCNHHAGHSVDFSSVGRPNLVPIRLNSRFGDVKWMVNPMIGTLIDTPGAAQGVIMSFRNQHVTRGQLR
jgi:hypothetical protein